MSYLVKKKYKINKKHNKDSGIVLVVIVVELVMYKRICYV